MPAASSASPGPRRHARRCQHRDGRQQRGRAASARRLAVRFASAERGHTGRPLGRLRISRIGLSTIVVENTDYWGSLSKGPGRYQEGSFPGLGRTTGIAGHRTTFAAPFRHIDSIRNGDPIVLQMPYGTFTYRVLRHRIVDNGDWSIMREVGFDELVLSACHPLYSASHRYVIFARLESVKLPGTQRRRPCSRLARRGRRGVAPRRLRPRGRSVRLARLRRSPSSPAGTSASASAAGRTPELMREVCAERLGAVGHEAHGPQTKPLRIPAQRLREWELEGDGSRVGSPRKAPQRRHSATARGRPSPRAGCPVGR